MIKVGTTPWPFSVISKDDIDRFTAAFESAARTGKAEYSKFRAGMSVYEFKGGSMYLDGFEFPLAVPKFLEALEQIDVVSKTV